MSFEKLDRASPDLWPEQRKSGGPAALSAGAGDRAGGLRAEALTRRCPSFCLHSARRRRVRRFLQKRE